MGVCFGIPYWIEFVSGWASASHTLRSVAASDPIPREILAVGDEAVLSWCWSRVADHANAVLFAIDQRTSMPSSCVVSHFKMLSGAGLILPDGSVVSYVLRAIERRLDANAADDNQRIADSALASQKLRDAMRPKGREAEAAP